MPPAFPHLYIQGIFSLEIIIMSNTTTASSVVGSIKMGKNTKNHAAALRKMGYEVTEEGDELKVQVTGFVQHLDLSENQDALKEVIAKKQALTYSTKVLFKDGKSLFGVPACTRLGALSCLVMKPAKGAKKEKVESEFNLDDFIR